MSEYLSKKAVLDAIETEQVRLMGEHQSVTGYHKRYVTGKYDGLNWIKHQIQSSGFDVPEMEHVNAYWAREGLIKHQKAEVQRLRAALESLPDKIMQISRFADTEELTFPLENPTAEEQSEWLDEFLDRLDMHVRNIVDNEIEALSTTTEPLNAEKVERVREGDGNE